MPELGLKYSEEGRGTTEEWVLFSVRHGLLLGQMFLTERTNFQF